jgi:hypothetical protein
MLVSLAIVFVILFIMAETFLLVSSLIDYHSNPVPFSFANNNNSAKI